MVALNGSSANGYANGSSTLSTDGPDFAVIQMAWTGSQPSAAPAASVAESWPSPEQEFLDGECVRLRAEIASAQQRTADATARAAARRSELRELLRAELAAARESLDEMQRQHDTSIAALRATAQSSIDRILAEGRQLSRVSDVD